MQERSLKEKWRGWVQRERERETREKKGKDMAKGWEELRREAEGQDGLGTKQEPETGTVGTVFP